MPYDMEAILQDLTIRIEVDYYTENSQSQYFSSFIIPVDLPLDVNVHDHFKRDILMSKFNIKTANQVPLQLFDVALQSSDEFDVQAPRRSKEPVYVFPKQPVAVTYKITKKPMDAAKRRQSKLPATGSLALSVGYRCLDEDVKDRLVQMFASEVAGGSAHRIGRLLTSTFANRLEYHVLPQQFERIALLEKVDLGSFDDMDWSDCIDGLPEIIRDDTRTWLQKWHEVSFSTSPESED
jgi:hypothetical protein